MENPVAANPGESAGSQSAEPSTALDNPSNLDFWEPGDEPANPESDGSDGIAQASEPAETTEGGQEAEAGTEEAADDGDKPAISDDYELDLGGGEKATIKELKLRGLREKDYRYKTENLSREVVQVKSQAANLQQSVNALADYLTSRLPPEPDPSLAYTDFQTYGQQKAIFEAAQAELHSVLQFAHQTQAVQTEVSQVERTQRLNMAAEYLAQDPDVGSQIRDPAKGKQFFETAYKAAEAAGYTRQELQAYTDPRAFKMAYLAGIGQQALAARAKAQTKVQNVPPVNAPNKARAAPNAAETRRNQEAMARLRKSSSKADALRVDFD